MRRLGFYSLELRKQLIILLLIIFIPFLAILLFTGYRQHRHTLMDIEGDANQAIRLFTDAQLNIINQTRGLLSVIAHVSAVRDLDLAPCNAFLQEIHQENPQYSTIVAANSRGIIDCCAVPLKKPIDVTDRGWFQRVTESKKFVIGDFIISRSAHKASLPFAMPVLDHENNLVAAVGAAYDLANYGTIFEGIVLPADSVIFVTDSHGVLLYGSVAKGEDIGKTLSEWRGFDVPEAKKGHFVVDDSDGVKRIYWFEKLSVGAESNQLSILIGVSEKAMYSQPMHMLAGNLSLLAVLASLCFALAWFFGKKSIVDPVNVLVKKIRHVQQGDLSPSNAVGSLPGEMNTLARSFDRMLSNLSQRETERDEALDELKQEITRHTGTVAALREREEHLRILFEQAADAIYVCKPDGRLIKVNQQACRATGYTEDELLRLNVFDLDVQIASAESFGESIREFSHDNRLSFESTHRRKDGSTFPIEVTAAFLQTPDGPQMIGFVRDITERKRVEEDLRFHKAILEETGHTAKVGGWRFNTLTREGFWTEEVARIHDLDPSLPPTPDEGVQYYVGESRRKIEAAVKDAVERGIPYDLELEFESAGGVRKWVRTIGHPILEDGRVAWVQGSFQDISDHKQAEDALRASLEEKVALLKEVHHRVKNNLQIVASLLGLQAGRSGNEEVVNVLRDTRNRVRSMALLHETLYRSGNLARINFAAYLQDLCRQLLLAFSAKANRIRMEYHIAPLELSMEQALPIGLIVSELVSNALKHGFPAERGGRIVVGLGPAGEEKLVLTVEDDGVGMPPDFNTSATATLGLQLVTGLVRQLKGQLEVESSKAPGTLFRIVFAMPKDTRLGEEA
jgi:PAS domain S-box-containing protein